MTQGVEIGIFDVKYITLPCKAFRLEKTPAFPLRSKKIRDDRHGPTSWVSVTLTEGKFRQVRKMCAAVGYPVLRLIRVRVGKIHLGDLKSGEVLKLEQLNY
jgi:23S rRNA pseudouridine2457 synthase